MQWNRLDGLALAGLGLMLLGLQGALILPAYRSVSETSSPVPAVERRIYPMPGILGAIALLGAAAIQVRQRGDRDVERRRAAQ